MNRTKPTSLHPSHLRVAEVLGALPPEVARDIEGDLPTQADGEPADAWTARRVAFVEGARAACSSMPKAAAPDSSVEAGLRQLVDRYKARERDFLVRERELTARADDLTKVEGFLATLADRAELANAARVATGPASRVERRAALLALGEARTGGRLPRDVLESAAEEFLDKEERERQRAAARGERAAAAKVAREEKRAAKAEARDAPVLEALGRGLTQVQAAAELGISRGTVARAVARSKAKAVAA